MEANKRILFFDGVCHLCNWVVDFSLPHFSPHEIYFAPLQGSTAQKTLSTQDLGLNYVIYLRDGQLLKKSQAVVYLLKDMSGVYKVLGIMLHLIPDSVSDFFYDVIAKYRYRLFGKDEVCRLPRPEERPFFLD